MLATVMAVGAVVLAGPAQAEPANAWLYLTVVPEGQLEGQAGVPVQVATTLTDATGESSPADVLEATTESDGTVAFGLSFASDYVVEVGGGTSGWAPGSASFPVTRDSATTCTVTLREAGSGAASDLTCSPPLVAVERFWSPVFANAHFFTTDQLEVDHLLTSDPNWWYEGTAFEAVGARDGSCSAGVPVFRFYSPGFASHFYTMDADEKARIIASDPAWAYEGVAFCAFDSPAYGRTALYRFWSPVFGKHFYTADQGEADHLRAVDRNWTYEGIAGYVLPVAA